MSRKTNARVAGFAGLVYIATALSGLILSSRAAAGEGAAAKLASIARHAADVRFAVVLVLLGCYCALVLAVTLYAITRDVDRDLALLVLAFRVGEGVIGAVSLPRLLGRLWLATSPEAAADPAAAGALTSLLVKLPSWTGNISASFFSVGSLVFAYLLLRGRIVPAALAWVGVLASILAVVVLPLDVAGILRGPITEIVWWPMLAFEVPLAFWLIFKGAAAPVQKPTT
jgi:hypothetical protein